MLIKDWMSKSPVTAKPTTSIMKAAKLMKENGFGRLPVIDDDGRLVGIVSDRDIKEASPSKATTLDMHELYYLLSEIKVGDIMTKTVVSIGPDDTVEKAAVLMLRPEQLMATAVSDSERQTGTGTVVAAEFLGRNVLLTVDPGGDIGPITVRQHSIDPPAVDAKVHIAVMGGGVVFR